MNGAIDYNGIGVLIAAVGSAIAAIIAALASLRTNRNISTNGDPRTLGEIATDVAAQVAPHDPTPPTNE